MMADKEITTLGRDTTMCGDPKVWFPMRVTYSRELKIKAELDRLKIENFIPMTYKLLDADTERPHRDIVSWYPPSTISFSYTLHRSGSVI